MASHLHRVTITRFKGIDSIDFNLGDLSVFVGGNNSGKTTVIQAIHFAFTLFQSLEISQKWPSRNQRSSTISPDEMIYVPSLDPYTLGSGGKLWEAEARAIEFEFFFSDGQSAQLKIRKGRIKNVIVEPTNVAYLRNIAGLNTPYSIFSPGLAGVSKSEQYVSDGILLRALSRGDANAFLRNILLRLHQNDNAWDGFLEDLSLLFPSIQFRILFEVSVDEVISVDFERSGIRVPLDLAGTGLLQAIQILAYMHLFNPKIMVFDEPDSHLHPNNQRNLCALLHTISTDRATQVLLTTHSRHVIDALSNDAQIIDAQTSGIKMIWMYDGSARAASKDDQIDLLVDLGALDVRERLQDHGIGFIFLTEDTYTGGFKKVIIAHGFDAAEFEMLSYKGVTGVHFLQPLIRQIRQITNATIVVHRDRDFMAPDEVARWEQEIRALQAEPFVTSDRDIEGYLLSDVYLARVLQENGLPDLAELKQMTVEGQHDNLVAKFVNGRVDIERKSGRHGVLDHGGLAVAANREAREDPWGTMLPKDRRRRIRHILQSEYNRRLPEPEHEEIDIDQRLESIRLRH